MRNVSEPQADPAKLSYEKQKVNKEISKINPFEINYHSDVNGNAGLHKTKKAISKLNLRQPLLNEFELIT